jgi:hypothetical protein
MASNVIPPQPIPLNQPFPPKPKKYYHSYYHGTTQTVSSGTSTQPTISAPPPQPTAQIQSTQATVPTTYAPYPSSGYISQYMPIVVPPESQPTVAEPRTNVSLSPQQG